MANFSASETPPEARGFIDRTWHDLRIAAAFLTRLPVAPPQAAAGGTDTASLLPEDAAERAGETSPIARALGMFPLVGVGVGGAAAIAMVLADRIGLHPLACAIIAVGVQSAITGALHEDGLADFADGLAGGGDTSSRLAIMRDSRIGTFGALALILSVALKATLLSQLSAIETATAALISAAAVSRGTLPALMRWARPARSDGLMVTIGRPEPAAVTTAIMLSFVVAVIAHGLGIGILVCIVGAGGATLVAIIAARSLGGLTGDGLGTAEQVAELFVLAAIAATQ